MALDDSRRTADAELLAAYAAGDRAAARVLVTEYGPLAHRLAVRLMGAGAEAEDVAQEAMLRLWRAAPTWRAGEALISTWLYRVTANLCTDRRRRKRAQTWPEGFDPADERPSPEARLQAAARSERLQAAIARLPDRQRIAMVLRHFEERGNAEIADVLEISVEAVESLLSRGKRALKAALAAEAATLGYEDE